MTEGHRCLALLSLWLQLAPMLMVILSPALALQTCRGKVVLLAIFQKNAYTTRAQTRIDATQHNLTSLDAPHTMITSPQMAAIVTVLARAVVISSCNFESHGWKHVVATRAHVVVD